MFRHRAAVDISAMRDDMRNRMEEEGLPYGNRSMVYNSRLAQELGSWADTQQSADDIHDLLFRAYFVENQNISDVEVLVSLAGEAGLDQEEARQILQERIFSPQVDMDWERSRQAGITGVPTFSSRELYVVGCQPYEILERFVNHLHELQVGD
jgi:predicted DsbA family dithiol-disulfide isomerase|tara:strand:- start:1079 stop:1537 length:459 start_codon:yes stop_codon:yes gene_type:complete